MPKRSNKFQRLILLLNACLAAGSRVEESAMVADKVTGELREVDIWIQAKTAAYEINVAIEVVGRGRKADTPWIECMYSKHATLPTDKLMLVAEAGFTKPALVKAKFFGIEAVTIETALDTDWNLLVNLTEKGFFELITFNYNCSIVYLLSDGERRHMKVPTSAAFSFESGTVTLDDFVKKVLAVPQIKGLLFSRIISENQRQFCFSYKIPFVCTMSLDSDTVTVAELWVGLEADRSVTPIQYASGVYRDTPFYEGSSTESTELQFVIIKKQDGSRGGMLLDAHGRRTLSVASDFASISQSPVR